MARYIDADKLIEALEKWDEQDKYENGVFAPNWFINYLRIFPTEKVLNANDATMLGYPLKELIAFAKACRDQHIRNDQLLDFVMEMGKATEAASEAFKRSVMEAYENYGWRRND